MTSVSGRRALIFVLAGLALPVCAIAAQRSAATPTDPLAPLPAAQGTQPAPKFEARNPQSPKRVAPAYLARRIDELGQSFDGRVGIAVQAVDAGWATDWKGDEFYPQQSVSKMWVAVTALNAADRGLLRLTDKVRLTPADLTVFHQPIRELITGKGAYTTTLDDLLVRAITTSDNTANDKLMRAAGGAKAVRAMIAAKKLGKIRFYDGEKALQSRIAGLIWSPRFSFGSTFWQARDALPLSVRSAAFRRYVADPYDGAAPSAIVGALARLKRGELLSPASTRKLLGVMGNTKTGANRLKGGLKAGWTLSHKTGTGQELGREQAGYNDIGILTAPDGRSYAVAVMIKLTSAPLGARMALMNEVVRAVIAQHETEVGSTSGGRH